MSMYGDCYGNYPQDAPIQWREPQRNYETAFSNSPPSVPLLAITVIIIFFLGMSALFGFYKEESHQSRSELFSLYLILIVLFLVLLYVAWRMFWDSFILGTRPSNCYRPQVNQVVDGVSGSGGGGGGGLSVMMAAVFLALTLALVFCNPVLSVPVALAGVVNLLATVL